VHFPISDYKFATHQDQLPPWTEGGDSTDETLNGQSGAMLRLKTPPLHHRMELRHSGAKSYIV
jgi:hypothetical protein